MIENFARELPRFIYTCLAILLAYELMGHKIANVEQCKHQPSQTAVVAKLEPTIVKSVELKTLYSDEVSNNSNVVQLEPIIIRGRPLKEDSCVSNMIAQSEQELMGNTILDLYSGSSYIKAWNSFQVCQSEIDEFFDIVGEVTEPDGESLVSLLQSYALARHNYELAVTNIISGKTKVPDTCWLDSRRDNLYCNDSGVIENIQEYKDTLRFGRIVLPEYYNLGEIETDKLRISGFAQHISRIKNTERKILKAHKCKKHMVCNTKHHTN